VPDDADGVVNITVGTRIWEKMLELSECRVELETARISLDDAISVLPAHQLEGLDQLASALIDWLADIRQEAQAGQAQQPVKLGEQRIKRGRGTYAAYPESS
jgi:hypothetical protein